MMMVKYNTRYKINPIAPVITNANPAIVDMLKKRIMRPKIAVISPKVVKRLLAIVITLFFLMF